MYIPLKRVKRSNLKPGQPHSERAGEALLGTGTRAALYRALRELSCSRCGGVIREAELFTREAESASGLPLVRRCRVCVPFTTRSSLLDTLFASEGGSEPTPTVETARAREKAMSRLGPALARRRKHSADDND